MEKNKKELSTLELKIKEIDIKKEREHAIEVKDMMLSLRIDEHDLKVKLKHMREFLTVYTLLCHIFVFNPHKGKPSTPRCFHSL